MFVQVIQGQVSDKEKAHERFRAAAGEKGRRTGWRSFLDPPADALAREARAADLVVLGRHREGFWQELFNSDAALYLR